MGILAKLPRKTRQSPQNSNFILDYQAETQESTWASRARSIVSGVLMLDTQRSWFRSNN